MEKSRQAKSNNQTATPKRFTAGSTVLRRLTALRAWMIPFVVAHQQRVLVATVVIVLLMEIIEHLLVVWYGEQVHIVYDIVVYTLFFPALIWLMISMLKSTESQREKADQANDLRSEFSQKIGNVRDWAALTRLIVEFAHQVAPQAKTTLLVYNNENMHMRVEAMCEPSGLVTLQPRININPESQPVGSLPHLLMKNSAGPGLSAASVINTHLPNHGGLPLAPQPKKNRYDLQIIRYGQPIGILKVEYPSGQSPTPEEIDALKSAEPMIALALEGIQLQNLALEQAAYSETQRQRIAQNLHDSLAQNISYLRLKLDQLTGENAIHEINVVLQELERMRTSADEAYQQVRNTLDELGPTRPDDLVTSILKQARIICQRSRLTLRSSQVGTPYTLPPAICQQIIYITREALHNIEKHAFAHQVHLHFLWLDGELILKITDDGVGFNPISITAEGHYGLWIMQHRANEIGGTLKINSLDMQEEGASGTEVTLWIPRPTNPVAQNE